MTRGFTPVSKAAPCPVCGGDHKCSTAADGLILCGRRSGPQDGFRDLGPCKRDGQWSQYRRADDPLASRRPYKGPRPPADDWQRRADACARNLTPERRDRLAAQLGLPPAALAVIPDLGWDDREGGWTWPEYDGHHRVIGLCRRLPGGEKRRAFGSHAGLVLPAGWADRPGPVFVCEGMSDACALAHVGLAAVGRPSNTGGADHLADLFRHAPPGRPVVVLGENDAKPDGSWPGYDGCEKVAAALAAALPGVSVLKAFPPDGYKDVREWVVDRLGGRADAGHPHDLGKELADTFARAAEQAAAARAAFGPPRPGAGKVRQFPRAVPVTELAADPPAAAWVWDGYLARGSVTLLSALPKCGKTTLISHLLAGLRAGGEFLGRPLLPGRAVVVSEESETTWRGRTEALGLTAHVRVACRPFFGRPTEDQWKRFLAEQMQDFDADPCDLVVFDTLADLWPVRDENSAAEVTAALQPLKRLAAGRAVLVVHHLRKSDGEQGTGSRGSGALAGTVDLLMELRRAGPQVDPTGKLRVIKGYGRQAGIPDEWVIRLTADGRYEFAGTDPAAARGGSLADAIAQVLPTAEAAALTRDEVWNALPDEWRKNAVRFRGTMEAKVGERWNKKGDGAKDSPYRYWRGG